MAKRTRFISLLGSIFLLLLLTASVAAIDIDPNDQPDSGTSQSSAAIVAGAGPTVIKGTVSYTNPFFTLGTAQPIVILEDQAGFVDRNEYFILPPESQVLGQITSDFYESPFTYSLALPIEPQGTLRDVDNDGQQDRGVMVFAVAYWSNTFGDPFLEERDLYGGGWSTAYASTLVSSDPDLRGEIIGGQFIVYAPDGNQGFPSDFGADGLLFTEDDPIMTIPAGYSVVNLDTSPFEINRDREQFIDLIEPQSAAVDDFSTMSYTDAFDAMVLKLSREYAFTEYKGLDWDELSRTYRPRFQEAQASNDNLAYNLALRDFLWEIPDGHVSMALGPLIDLFRQETDGGLGLAIAELDDGRIIISYVVEGSPAHEAGIQLGAEILTFNGREITDLMEEEFIWAHQASGTAHAWRLQQLRYVTRFPLGEQVEVAFRNPGSLRATTVTLPTIPERESWSFSSFFRGNTGFELPLDYYIHPAGYAVVQIYSFSDNEVLTIQLWERLISSLNQAQVPGLIIDMRQNTGGSGFLADQMAAYFFNEPFELGQTGGYSEEKDEFVFSDRGVERFYLPAEDMRYQGEVVVIVSPACFSACEFFSYDMTVNDRAAIIGHYPTGGLGGSVNDFYMPDGQTVRFTAGRAVDMNGNIHIEGIGVAPTVRIPVTEESVLSQGDYLLNASIEYLNNKFLGGDT